MYLWGSGLNTEDLWGGGGEFGDNDLLCRLDKGSGGLEAWPKAPSGGNRWSTDVCWRGEDGNIWGSCCKREGEKIGGGGSKSSNVKSGEIIGNGMSNSSSS